MIRGDRPYESYKERPARVGVDANTDGGGRRLSDNG